MTVALLLLGAGASSRMRGGDKLLEPVAGQPCLRVLAERGLAAGLAVYVTLRPQDAARRAALADLKVQIIEVPDAALGMSHSLRAGARAMPGDLTGMMVLPGDMPEVTSDDIRQMAEHFAAQTHCAALRATAQDGRPGHPIIFATPVLAQFDQLSGDRGAAALLAPMGARLHHLALPDMHALRDLDTPEDWADWRAAQQDSDAKDPPPST